MLEIMGSVEQVGRITWGVSSSKVKSSVFVQRDKESPKQTIEMVRIRSEAEPPSDLKPASSRLHTGIAIVCVCVLILLLYWACFGIYFTIASMTCLRAACVFCYSDEPGCAAGKLEPRKPGSCFKRKAQVQCTNHPYPDIQGVTGAIGAAAHPGPPGPVHA